MFITTHLQRKVNFSEGSFHRPKQQKSDERKEGGLRNRRKVFELAKWPKYELIHFFFRSNSSKKFKLVHRRSKQLPAKSILKDGAVTFALFDS